MNKAERCQSYLPWWNRDCYHIQTLGLLMILSINHVVGGFVSKTFWPQKGLLQLQLYKTQHLSTISGFSLVRVLLWTITNMWYIHTYICMLDSASNFAAVPVVISAEGAWICVRRNPHIYHRYGYGSLHFCVEMDKRHDPLSLQWRQENPLPRRYPILMHSPASLI